MQTPQVSCVLDVFTHHHPPPAGQPLMSSLGNPVEQALPTQKLDASVGTGLASVSGVGRTG